MKKILAVLCAAMFAGQAWAETITSGNIVYEVTGDKVEVTRYTGSATTVSIPLYFVVSGKYYTPTSIGKNAFRNNTTITKVSISPNVKTIGEDAFLWCEKLEKVEFYDAGSQVSALATIETRAFEQCESLTSITIPSSVTRIGDFAFIGCTKLTAINVESGNAYYTSENGVLFNKNKTVLICYPCSRTGSSYNIPNSVKSIYAHAFKYCINLSSITIPNSVTSIGNYAIDGCSNLTSVTIGSSVTSIGERAFSFCGNLTSVTIPSSVTSIGDAAFINCSSLTTVTIPNSVTSIGAFTFCMCSDLVSITIPSSVTSIGSYASSHALV